MHRQIKHVFTAIALCVMFATPVAAHASSMINYLHAGSVNFGALQMCPTGVSFPTGASAFTGTSFDTGRSYRIGTSYDTGTSYRTGESFTAGVSYPTGYSYPTGTSVPTGSSYNAGGIGGGYSSSITPVMRYDEMTGSYYQSY
jgi:hypothetical protein